LAGLLVLSACVPHPVGPARTFGKYQGKAVTTAESALSAVNATRLAAGAGSRGNAFGPYLSVLVSEQEEAVAKAQGTFGSIQPPNEQADALRAELNTLLSAALDHVTAVRIAVRRGQLSSLADTAAPLSEDAVKLRSFSEGHR
jgi:hypothetical protein